MLIGAVSYTVSFLLFALNKTSYGYWPMIFPALILTVVGADLEFNVTNVHYFIGPCYVRWFANKAFRCSSCPRFRNHNKALPVAFYKPSRACPRQLVLPSQ